MKTQRVVGGCLIVCSWQPGATLETFNGAKFLDEVCLPLRDIISSPESPVWKVLILARCAKEEECNNDVEVGEWEVLPGEGEPAHILTPTSTAVLENLDFLVEKGQVLWLNVDSLDDDEAINQAVSFARNQGCWSVIIPRDVPIPDNMTKLGLLLKKAQETGLALHYTTEYPRTAEFAV